jgi:hypothetical protein
VAVSTATCTNTANYCRDSSGSLISGCNGQCGGLIGTCSGSNLTCYNSVFNLRPTDTHTGTSTNDGPFGVCVATGAINCSSASDCACLPSLCRAKWYVACPAGKCRGSCE